MPEHECLPPDQTAADVVATFGELSGLPPRAARQRASDVLDLVGLDEARFRPIEGFSTGMRQRTKLAQALVADPELVLLDEPTAGLDPMGRQEMLTLVARLGTFGISVVLATHLLDDVQAVCDHVVMINAGQLVLAGPTTQLLERPGTVWVDVGGVNGALVDALQRRGLASTVLEDASLEITIDGRPGDDVLDLVRDLVAELGLPLHALVDPTHLAGRGLPAPSGRERRRERADASPSGRERTSDWPERPRAENDEPSSSSLGAVYDRGTGRTRTGSAGHGRRRSPCTEPRSGGRWGCDGHGARRSCPGPCWPS